MDAFELGEAPQIPKYRPGCKIPPMDHRLSDQSDFLGLMVFMSDAGDDLLWLCRGLDEVQKHPYMDLKETKKFMGDVAEELRKIANSLIIPDEVDKEDQASSSSDESERSLSP
jgi:hypothetical protein